MSARGAARLAWSLWAAFVMFAAGTVALVAFQDVIEDELIVVALTAYASVGALIASRQPENSVGWILLVIGLAFALNAFAESYAATASNPGRVAVAWLAGWFWYLWLALAAFILPLVFPHGRLLSRRWRLAVWLTLAALILSIPADAFKTGQIDIDGAPVENPFGVSGVLGDALEIAGIAGDVLAICAFAAGAAALVVRFRRSQGRERQQLKWLAYIDLLALGFLSLTAVETLLGGAAAPQWADVFTEVAWVIALLLVLVGIPVATGLAILRHHLYDIDLVINRTLVYAALTATLAATYLASVLLVGLAVGESGLAVAVSTLAVAALFRPARARIQAEVDRRFYRRRYDAARTLESFGARLRDELDLEALTADLRGVVRETVQPAHVSLWLRSDR
jgi:hypothetical protein